MTTPPIDWLGPTPWETVAAAFAEQCPDGYPMQLVGEDAEVATSVINQGIDSRLTAVTFSPGARPSTSRSGPTAACCGTGPAAPTRTTSSGCWARVNPLP